MRIEGKCVKRIEGIQFHLMAWDVTISSTFFYSFFFFGFSCHRCMQSNLCICIAEIESENRGQWFSAILIFFLNYLLIYSWYIFDSVEDLKKKKEWEQHIWCVNFKLARYCRGSIHARAHALNLINSIFIRLVFFFVGKAKLNASWNDKTTTTNKIRNSKIEHF